MNQVLVILKTLKMQDLNNIDIHQIINHLETLDDELLKTKFVGKILKINERLANHFFTEQIEH